jgi:glycosyltransferase involved in cell wall biosynthesis
MRVLHVLASAGEMGGGEVHLCTLLPELRRMGLDCEAAVSPRGALPERLQALGFTVHGLELMRSRTDPTAPTRLARLLRDVRPDVVHYHGTRAAFFGALARRLVRHHPRMVYTVHNLSYAKESSTAGRMALLSAELLACRTADAVLCVSRRDLGDLEERRLLPPGRGRWVPNAVDTERFHPGDREAARTRLGLSDEEFVVGSVARLVPQKSVADLVEAARLFGGATLVVVGDGPERAALEAQARPLGSRVRFLGEREDVPELLRAFDAFALSSRWEAEPISLLEAMATGLPCIATATDGAREILDGTRAGVLTTIGSPQALASAMAELAAAPFHRREMGRAGLEAVQARSPARLAVPVAEMYG